MGSSGTVDIRNPKYPVRLIRAWHAQATYLVPSGRFSEWVQGFPAQLLKAGYDPFLPAGYRPSLVDGKVQLTFFFVNHLESDLGSYLHAGIITRVAPESVGNSYPGFYIGLEVVDQGFTWIGGYKIWGYAKVLGCVDVNGSVPEGSSDLTVSVKIPKTQPDRDKEDETYKFDPSTCTEPVFTMTLQKPDGVVLPYERDVYNHTVFKPSNRNEKGPCETRFVRHSANEGVQPWANGVRLNFDKSSAYGSWLGTLDMSDLGQPEVRWAPQMSGEWNKAKPLWSES